MVHGARVKIAEVDVSTTPFGMLPGKFLRPYESLVEEGVHPSVITKSLRRATQVALENVIELSVYVDEETKRELQDRLVGYATAGTSSKSNHQLDASLQKRL